MTTEAALQDLFPPPPEHPHAATVAAALERLRFVLAGWTWNIYNGDELAVVLWTRGDPTTLRVWVKDDLVNFDVSCLRVPYHPHILTWILMENLGQEFVARAVRPEDDSVPIYLTANYPLVILENLPRTIWHALETELRWRGRLMEVRIPEEPEGLSA